MYVFALKMKHKYDEVVYFRHVRAQNIVDALAAASTSDPFGEVLDSGMVRKLKDREVADYLLEQKSTLDEISDAIKLHRKLPLNDGKPLSVEMRAHVKQALAIIGEKGRGFIIGKTISSGGK